MLLFLLLLSLFQIGQTFPDPSMNQLTNGMSPQVMNVIMSQSNGRTSQSQSQQTPSTTVAPDLSSLNNGNDPMMSGEAIQQQQAQVFKREIMDAEVRPY